MALGKKFFSAVENYGAQLLKEGMKAGEVNNFKKALELQANSGKLTRGGGSWSDAVQKFGNESEYVKNFREAKAADEQMRTARRAMKGDYRAMKHGIMSEETFNSRNAQFLTGNRDEMMSQLERQYQILQKRSETKAQYNANKKMTGNSRTGMASEDWARQYGEDMSIGELNIRQSNDFKQAVRTREYQDNYYAQKHAAQEQATEEARAAADEKRWQAELNRENVSDVRPGQESSPIVGGKSQGQTAVQEQSGTAASRDRTAALSGGTDNRLERALMRGSGEGGGYKFMEKGARQRALERTRGELADIDKQLSSGSITTEDARKQKAAALMSARSGPNTMDYIIGNNVHGKAAGVAIGAGVMSAIMGDGRRSNAQLYSSPF